MIKTKFNRVQFGVTHELPVSANRITETGKNNGGKTFSRSDYFVGKCAQTWEALQAQMGIGPYAWKLPMPPMFEVNDDDVGDESEIDFPYRVVWIND